jgi:hypothetical protein
VKRPLKYRPHDPAGSITTPNRQLGSAVPTPAWMPGCYRGISRPMEGNPGVGDSWQEVDFAPPRKKPEIFCISPEARGGALRPKIHETHPKIRRFWCFGDIPPTALYCTAHFKMPVRQKYCWVPVALRPAPTPPCFPSGSPGASCIPRVPSGPSGVSLNPPVCPPVLLVSLGSCSSVIIVYL